MFTKKPAEEGCGKWLSTKTTRKIAQSIKNTSGSKKGKKKPLLFKNVSDHIPGAIISSSPLSSREIEMLSRVKQSKMDQFFKPVESNNQKENAEFEDDLGLRPMDEEKCDNSERVTRKHQKLPMSSQLGNFSKY